MSGRGCWWREPEPCDPWTNMTRDAALLETLGEGKGETTVRIYQWDRPAVTVGRLQDEDAVREIFPLLPIIPRPTGGRAVLHGEDLTITVAVLESSLAGAGSGLGILASSRLIVSTVSSALMDCGVETTFGVVSRGSQCQNCFETAAPCDLIDGLSGRKILGSAQRREQGAILQQMSLCLDVLSDVNQFEHRLRQELSTVLGVCEWDFN